MSKPKIYRRRHRGAPATHPQYAIQRPKLDGPVPLPAHVHILTDSELEERYGVRPASDRALGLVGVALAVVALLGLAAAVLLGGA